MARAIKNEHGLRVGNAFIAKVLKQNFDMSYTSVSHQALKANAPRSLVIRSLYAQELLKLLQDNYRVINID